MNKIKIFNKILLAVVFIILAGGFLFVPKSHAAIAFRGVTDFQPSGSSVAVPAGVQNGDLLIAVWEGWNTTCNCPPSSPSWTMLTFASGGYLGGEQHAVFYRIASSEPASYTFTTGASQYVYRDSWGMIAYSGTMGNSAAINTYADTGQTTLGTVTTITAPAVTTTVANTLLLSIAFTEDANGGTVTAVPSGETQRWLTLSGNANTFIGGGDVAVAGTGNTGTKDFTSANLASYAGGGAVSIAIAPYVANTAPVLTAGPNAISYAGYTRTGPNNPNWTMYFAATDAEQSGGNQLTWYIHTGANQTGTLVTSGTTTGNGTNYGFNFPYNSTGMFSGTNNMYFRLYDGFLYSSSNPMFTIYRDDTAPTAATSISTTPSPVTSTSYTVTFTPNDAISTNTNEISYQIRTAAAGGGTLLTSGTSTNASATTTSSFTDSALVGGANTRYVRTCDGANNCTDTSFTVTYSPTATSVSTTAPTGLNSYYATLNGSANPNGYATTGHFRVFTASPADCTTDTGGIRFPALQASDIPVTPTDTSVHNFSYTIPFNSGTFLTPNTTYYYCSYAINTNGTAGATSVTSFFTPFGPANPCDAPMTGNLALPVSAACAFSGTTIDGVDVGTGTSNTGSLTLASLGQLSVSSGQKIGYGSLSMQRGATLIIARGGMLSGGGIYVHDADSDGVLDDNQRLVQSTQPAGYVRRTAFKSTATNSAALVYSSNINPIATFDCNTANSFVNQTVPNLVTDADNDGYKTVTSAGPQCVGTASTINGRTYYKDTSNAYTFMDAASALASGATDCNDATGAPCPPTVGSVSTASQTSVSVTWSATTGPTPVSYTVTCVSGTGCSNTSRGTQSSGFTDSGLTCGITYTYNVVAVNAAGNSAASSNFSGSTGSCANIPGVTTSPGTILDTSGQVSINISINGGTSNMLYWWTYGTTNTGNCATLASTTSSTGYTSGFAGGSMYLSPLSPNTTYYYCAAASNQIGTGYSSITSFTTKKSNGTACASGSECSSGNCYVDADGDRYAPASGTMTCKASAQIAGTDCYDSNANAYPGQTSYFMVNRGDGSYDYNCDAVATRDSTLFGWPTTNGISSGSVCARYYMDHTLSPPNLCYGIDVSCSAVPGPWYGTQTGTADSTTTCGTLIGSFIYLDSGCATLWATSVAINQYYWQGPSSEMACR